MGKRRCKSKNDCVGAIFGAILENNTHPKIPEPHPLFPFGWISDPLMLSCRGETRVFGMLTLYNGMGSFSDVVWVVSSVTKTIRGASYPPLVYPACGVYRGMVELFSFFLGDVCFTV